MLKRMFTTGPDIQKDYVVWNHTVDLINGSVGIQVVGSENIEWHEGSIKFMYCNGGSGANRVIKGLKVQPFATGDQWLDVRKSYFTNYPANGTKVNLILDLDSDDTIYIPNPTYQIYTKNVGETILAINRYDTATSNFFRITHQRTEVEGNYDSFDAIAQIKAFYREKGWLTTEDGSDTITIPSDYVTVLTNNLSVDTAALPPEIVLHETKNSNQDILLIPYTVYNPSDNI